MMVSLIKLDDGKEVLYNMTQGISSSLNLTLARLNSIENNFAALQNISNQLIGVNNNANISNINQNRDFQTILDEKLNELSSNDNKKLDKKIDEEIEASPLDEEISSETKKAINLKSKINLKSQATNVDEIIDTFATKYDIDGDFIKAIIKQESGFNPKATSKKGAMGLMQLMPSTAKSLGVNDAYNPWENVEGGVKYLQGLLNRFDGDKKLALAAYNAGSGAVKKYGGIPPYKETQNYVNSILSTYDKLKGAKL